MKVIITGASGMVGEGVLYECLNDPRVSEVLVIGRKPCGHTHPKLAEIIRSDLYDLSDIESQLKNYDSCFFCLGISSIGMKEEDYFKITYMLTLNFAKTLSRLNPGMTFCYVSGKSTDSSEKGKLMWARVKGKTENDLMKLSFKSVYIFRPGYLHPNKGLKNTLRAYKYVSWMYPVIRPLFPNYVGTLRELGLAMINSADKGFNKHVLEVKDIRELSEK